MYVNNKLDLSKGEVIFSKLLNSSILMLFLSIFCLLSCQQDNAPIAKRVNQPLNKSDSSRTKPPLRTLIKYQAITKQKLKLNTRTTGKLIPHQQSSIHLKASGIIQKLPIKEGQLLKKGELIAALEDKTLQLALEEKELAFQEAIVNKKDLLIANGGKAAVDTSVSPDRLDLILTISGFRRAKQGIKQAQFQLDQTKIYAPFSGIIADLKVNQYQQGNAGQEICRLFNPHTFEAEFQLTESEALRIKINQAVKVSPLAMPEKSFSAIITTINPIVNQQGLVTVRAKLKNSKQQRLLDGMNVNVQIQRTIPNQLLIPKSALVLRSGKKVVFTYDEKEQVAKWNYVVISYENENQLAISDGLQAGDLVIYQGNLNLSHDAAVEIEATK
jgi:RND family efflux transporter MFP subunit